MGSNVKVIPQNRRTDFDHRNYKLLPLRVNAVIFLDGNTRARDNKKTNMNAREEKTYIFGHSDHPVFVLFSRAILRRVRNSGPLF